MIHSADTSLPQSLLSSVPSEQYEARSAGRSPSPAPAPAPPASSCHSLSLWYASHLPNPHSRIAFALSFLLALALSLWWLISTVRSKWLQDIAHPVQAVSWDREIKFTALFGLPLLYDDITSNDQNASYVRKVMPSVHTHIGCALRTSLLLAADHLRSALCLLVQVLGDADCLHPDRCIRQLQRNIVGLRSRAVSANRCARHAAAESRQCAAW